ncbi:MAG: glycosyltransferase [Thiotrichales bacterium]
MGEQIKVLDVNGTLYSTDGVNVPSNNPLGKLRVLVLGKASSASYESLHELLSLFGSVSFRNEKSIRSEDDVVSELLSTFSDLVMMPNPYGNGRRKRIYQALKEQGYPVCVFDRGGLPDSWFFDVGFNAESRSYSPLIWDKPLSSQNKEKVERYIEGLRAGGAVLEVQGDRLGPQALRKKLGLEGKKVLFVPFQRPGDTTIRFFSGLAESPSQFSRQVSEISRLLREHSDEWVVIGKKHPLEKQGPAVDIKMVDDDTHIYDLLDVADAVCLVNSGTGLLAALWDKPVYHFGEVYYGHPELSRRVGRADEVVHSLLHSPVVPSAAKRNRLVSHLIENIYSFGDITAERIDERSAYRTVTRNIAFNQVRFPLARLGNLPRTHALFVTSVIPAPINRGSVVRTEQMLRALIESGVKVDLVLLNQSEPGTTSKDLHRRMREIFPELGAIVVRRHPRLGKRGLNMRVHQLMLALDRIRFRHAEIVNSSDCPENLVRAVKAQLARKPYSFLFANYLKLAGSIPVDWWPKTVVDLHDVQSDRIQNDVLPKLPGWLRRPYLRQFSRSELRWLKRMGSVVCISPSDKRRIDALTHGSVNSITIAAAYQPENLPEEQHDVTHDLLFVGSNSDANAKSLFWFLKEVFPGLLSRQPTLRLRIVGRVSMNRIIQELPGRSYYEERGSLQCDTYVEQISDAYAQARVVVAPILMGTGMKIKIIEALAYGKPVVGTAAAFEGISVVDDQSAIFAESVEAFTTKILELLGDQKKLDRLSEEARGVWASEYTHDVSVYKVKEEIVNQMLSGKSRHE